MIALNPRAPVFFSIACLDIACKASGEKDNLTCQRIKTTLKKCAEDEKVSCIV